MLILLVISYFRRRRNSGGRTPVFFMTSRLAVASAALGVITGFDDFMYSLRHKFTPFSINAVVLLSIGSAVLGLHSSKDRPKNVNNFKYYLGFALTLGAAMLYGMILPLVELTYRKAKQTITYTLVMEIQMVLSFSATAFCTVGMLVNNDFQVIKREGSEFGLGEVKYYLLLVFTAIVWQLFFIGAVGVVFCASSLFSGVLISLLLPVTEILAVFFLHEKFGGEKAISLILSLWGFASYFYGEYALSKKKPLTPTSPGDAQLQA
ncbi:Purine permease 3 [Nymphaea thermarum]|nr:Purine permease 3 [Nymphaea thermarum]